MQVAVSAKNSSDLRKFLKSCSDAQLLNDVFHGELTDEACVLWISFLEK
jgi:hypothetical protein